MTEMAIEQFPDAPAVPTFDALMWPMENSVE
jgi:hypothetical protein